MTQVCGSENCVLGIARFQNGFNAASNQISTSGFTDEAAGNMTVDGFHTYAYDAEGIITGADDCGLG